MACKRSSVRPRSAPPFKTAVNKHFTASRKKITLLNFSLRNRRLDVLSNPKNINKKDSEISFRTVNLEISTMHNFFNYCIKKGIIDKNPCTGIKKLNELSRLKTLSDDDIDKLIAGATNKLTRDLITFLIYMGCRKGKKNI